jgi:hypothetical protein
MSSSNEAFVCSCRETLRTTDDVSRHELEWFDHGHNKQCQHPGCERLSPQTSNAKRHWRTHLPANLRRHFCSKCDASYAKQEHLEKHEAKATCLYNRKRCRNTLEDDPAPSIPPSVRQRDTASPDRNAVPMKLENQSTGTGLPSFSTVTEAARWEPMHFGGPSNITTLPFTSAASWPTAVDPIDWMQMFPSCVRLQSLPSLPESVRTDATSARLGFGSTAAPSDLRLHPTFPRHHQLDVSSNLTSSARGQNPESFSAACGSPSITELIQDRSHDAHVDIRMQGLGHRVATFRVELFGLWSSEASFLDDCTTKRRLLPSRPHLVSQWSALVVDLAKRQSEILQQLLSMHSDLCTDKHVRSAWSVELWKTGDQFSSHWRPVSNGTKLALRSLNSFANITVTEIRW